MDKLLRGPALNKAVRDYVKQYILEHNLSGGDPLPPETQLAQDLGVGRSSVREAIKALQSLGIIEARHGDGLYVREYNLDSVLETLSYNMRLDPARLVELFQIRIWLESAVIEDAVKQIGPEEIARLEELMEEWEKRAHSGGPPADLDEQFHRILYSTLNNQTLLKLIDVFWTTFKDAAIKTDDLDPRGTFERHAAILEVIKTGDAALARQHLIDHFTFSLVPNIDKDSDA